LLHTYFCVLFMQKENLSLAWLENDEISWPLLFLDLLCSFLLAGHSVLQWI
jgi:hypothetical protein